MALSRPLANARNGSPPGFNEQPPASVSKEANAQNARPVAGLPSPWLYITTLYFPFGLMGAGLCTQLPNNLFKLLEYSNQQIGLIGGLGLIGSLRFLFAPWLDGAATKRSLSILTLVCSGTLALVMALVTYAQPGHLVYLWVMIGLMFCLFVVSAAHETAADGYYIRALDQNLQAKFIGIKTASIRLGIIAASTGLLLFATRISADLGAVDIQSADKSGFYTGFAAAFALAGAVLLGTALYNKCVLPKLPDDQPVRHGGFALGEVIRDYLKQDRVALIIALILFYRLGEGFLAMKYPFYLDARSAGGLGIAAADLAWISILAEMPWMVVGGILGGFAINWLGLRRLFIPMALAINVPNLLYWWLARNQPSATVDILGQNLIAAVLIVSGVEAFFYGLSFSALFYYLHITATNAGRNKTSILAVSLALMGLGLAIPGMLSGFVQAAVGYTGVFLVSALAGLPAILVIPFIPVAHKSGAPQPSSAR